MLVVLSLSPQFLIFYFCLEFKMFAAKFNNCKQNSDQCIPNDVLSLLACFFLSLLLNNFFHGYFLLFSASLVFQTEFTPVITTPLAIKTIFAVMLAAFLVWFRPVNQAFNSSDSSISHRTCSQAILEVFSSYRSHFSLRNERWFQSAFAKLNLCCQNCFALR